MHSTFPPCTMNAPSDKPSPSDAMTFSLPSRRSASLRIRGHAERTAAHTRAPADTIPDRLLPHATAFWRAHPISIPHTPNRREGAPSSFPRIPCRRALLKNDDKRRKNLEFRARAILAARSLQELGDLQSVSLQHPQRSPERTRHAPLRHALHVPPQDRGNGPAAEASGPPRQERRPDSRRLARSRGDRLHAGLPHVRGHRPQDRRHDGRA